MTAIRATVIALASAPLALLASPVQAQIDDAVVLDILRQCARIDDATARLACFDNNVRNGNTNTPRPSVPGVSPRPQSSAAAPNNGPSGFGREDVLDPTRFQTPAGELAELTARVQSVRQINTGMYQFTLEDGAVWEFTESVDFSYRPPREGGRVTIDRAALGSFLMVFDSQRSIRVRRVR